MCPCLSSLERELLLFDLEHLYATRPSASPTAGTTAQPDFEDRTFFENLDRLTLLQRLMAAYEEPELEPSGRPIERWERTGDKRVGAELCLRGPLFNPHKEMAAS